MKPITLLRAVLVTALFALNAAWAEVPEGAVWIDVRSQAEYDAGHIDDAALMPFDGIENRIGELQLDKDAPIYLYCGSGGRASIAKARLQAEGYTNVTNAGGLEDARELISQDNR